MNEVLWETVNDNFFSEKVEFNKHKSLFTGEVMNLLDDNIKTTKLQHTWNEV